MPNKTPHQRFHRVAQLFDPPAYVKSAAEADVLGGGDCEEAAFADPERRYPIHTKAATWFSAAAFVDDEPAPSSATAVVRRNIDAAAARFRIGADVEAIRRKAAGEEDLGGLPDSDFAIIVRNAGGGVSSREGPMRDAGEVKVAADLLVQWAGMTPYLRRREAANRILVKAASLHVALPDEVEDALRATAGMGVGRRDEAAAAVAKRAALLASREPDVAAALRTMARGVMDPGRGAGKHATFLGRDEAVKLAEVLANVDHGTRLSAGYGQNGLEPVERVLFGLTKRAVDAFATAHVPVGAAYYRREDLANMDLGGLRDRLGEKLAEAATEDGVFVDAGRLAAYLSREGSYGEIDRALFPKVAAAMGVVPVAKGEVATARLDVAELRKIASALPDVGRGPRNLDEL